MRQIPDRRAAGAFTLMELLVVLVILATVTALAVRSVDGVLDQQLYEASQRSLEDIEAAVIGSPNDLAADGTRTISGFVADMGRLPKTVLKTIDGVNVLTLAELWEQSANPVYGVRVASDPEVLVLGGWRGPYLRLPLGSNNLLLDGWGNAFSSPENALPDNEDARLRDENNKAIGTANQDIYLVRHLGANSSASSTDIGLEKDVEVNFKDRFRAQVSATVQVFDEDGALVPSAEVPQITVKIFAPSPTDALAAKEFEATGNSNPFVITAFPGADDLTIGPRAIRAYLSPTDPTAAKSSVKYVTLQRGMNSIFLEIHLSP